jgi:hypothetical protein
VGEKITEIVNSYPPENKPFVFTYKSYLASQLAFAVPDIRVYCISDKIDAYDIWQKDLYKLRNRNGLFICNDMFFSKAEERYGNKVFTKYSETEEFSIYRGKNKIKNFFFTLCEDFNPSQLPEQYTADAVIRKTK